MSKSRVVILVAVAMVFLIGYGTSHTSEPPKELKLVNLLQESLADEFTPDREVVVSYVEMPPNTTLEQHWHPGEEFVYCLEGEAEILIDGESIMSTPGTVIHIPFKSMHTAISGDKGAKAVVFRVHTKGEPVRYLEKGGESEK